MPKQCVECRTVVDDDTPYCESCGYQFKNRAATPTGNLNWQYVSVAAAAGVIALGVYFFEFR
jgi:hypothetical protein